MPIGISETVARFIDSHRVARLATVDALAHPYIVPICYARAGVRFYSAIDEKPKRVPVRQLQRLRNIAVNPNAVLLIDEYSEDWSKLAYVAVHGAAVILEPESASTSEHAIAVAALRQKYPQYAAMRIDANPIIRIEAVRLQSWASGGNPA